ncbi:hypothetical protein ASZ78_007725, partial [Callipepla squamata]
MEGVEEKQGEELPVPSDLSQGVCEGPGLQRGPSHREDEEEENDDEREESQPTEERLEGVLDEDTVAEGLHKLGHSACGTEYVYLNLSLSGCELSDINILSRYIHLQKLELSCNKINDLSCVSHMPYLLELNASNNKLATYFGFKPPENLKEVDFSHNQISKMQDLSAYQSLTKLLLDCILCGNLSGRNVACLLYKQVYVSHNSLYFFLSVTLFFRRKLIVILNSNLLEKITGLDSLKTLWKLDLSSNKITSLEGLEGHGLLEVINLEDNQIAELSELECVQDLPLLRVLNLLKNPVQVDAVNRYDPPPEVVAAKDHMTQLMYSMLQPQRIFDSTLPSLDAPYPMLVLVGPLACGKRELTHRICRQFNNFFRYGPCHTTRAAYFGEENRLDYHFVSQEAFDKMVKTCVVINRVVLSSGINSIDTHFQEQNIVLFCFVLKGVRSLKNTYFKPRYILVVPMNKVKYEGHLRRKGLFSRPEIEEAVSRVDMYIRISEDLPGYFDAVINTDELDEAFAELSFLIKEYLGLEPPAVSDSSQDVNSKAGTGSRIHFLQEQRLSPSRGVTGTTQSSTMNGSLDSSAKNYSGGTLDKLTAQLSAVCDSLNCSLAYVALCSLYSMIVIPRKLVEELNMKLFQQSCQA